MATILSDPYDFNSLDDGDLNGQDSWSGATEFDVQGTTTFEGAKAVYIASGNDKSIVKAGTARTDGTIVVYIMPNDQATNEAVFGIHASNYVPVGTNLAYWITFAPGLGNYTLSLYNGSVHTQISGNWTPNEWNKIQFEWRSSDHTARASLNDGTFTAWTASTNFTNTLDRVEFGTGGNFTSHGDTCYFDYISETAYAPSSGTNMKVNIADAWKTVDSIKINVGDSWKTVTGAKVNIGDTWKTVF